MIKGQQSIEDKFVEELSSKLAANNIDILRDVSGPYALIEACFPMDSGRLDWSLIADRGESEVKKVSAFYGVERNEACKLYLREQIAMNDLAGKAYWINDNIDIVLAGDVRSFEETFDSLLWPPGHIYLLGEKGDWCLNVTLQDDLYFGHAPSKTLSS
jgi:hypothetical protein